MQLLLLIVGVPAARMQLLDVSKAYSSSVIDHAPRDATHSDTVEPDHADDIQRLNPTTGITIVNAIHSIDFEWT